MPLAGGQGDSVRVADLVFKPAGDVDVAAALSDLLEPIEERGFRLGRAARALDGRWVVDGWAATRFVAGAWAPAGRWPEILAAARAFSAALADCRRPEFLARRDDRWAQADAVAWGEADHEPLEPVGPLLARLRALRRPVDAAPQLVHGDLAGNLLLADGLPPAVIDVSPYWRPAVYADAVIAVDGLIWEGAGPELLALASIGGGVRAGRRPGPDLPAGGAGAGGAGRGPGAAGGPRAVHRGRGPPRGAAGRRVTCAVPAQVAGRRRRSGRVLTGAPRPVRGLGRDGGSLVAAPARRSRQVAPLPRRVRRAARAHGRPGLVPGVRHARLEHDLALAASTLVGAPVELVHCQTVGEELIDTDGHLASRPRGWTGGPSGARSSSASSATRWRPSAARVTSARPRPRSRPCTCSATSRGTWPASPTRHSRSARRCSATPPPPASSVRATPLPAGSPGTTGSCSTRACPTATAARPRARLVTGTSTCPAPLDAAPDEEGQRWSP